jgi:hypothetical protein
MFIGHYGASFAAKAISPRTPLATLFVAVQVLDLLFFTFVLVGVEHMRLVPGITEYNAYDLYDMPYTHSLAGSLAIAGAVGLAWRVARRSRGSALVIGAAVFSHFVVDVPMHTPDLPLLPSSSSAKIGLGLWNHRGLALAVELAVFVAGWALLAARDRRLALAKPMLGFVVVLLAILVATPFLPAPDSVVACAAEALGAYVALAVAAGLVERYSVRAP